jgi:hypothetical protein
MRKRTKTKKISVAKLFFGSGLHILMLLVLVNAAIFLVVHNYLNAQTCMTTAQVQADTRCLYILNSKVYDHGTRDAPHQGHPCGTDVTSIIPASHIADSRFTPFYVADICAAAAPTLPVATIAPTIGNTISLVPSSSTAPVPSQVCLGSCISPSTTQPSTVQPSGGIPSLNPSGLPIGNGSNGGLVQLLLQILLMLFQMLFGGGGGGDGGGGYGRN